MAVPKKRVSLSRRKMRRSHLALKAVGVSLCKNCGEMKLPHFVCNSCKLYKDIQL